MVTGGWFDRISSRLDWSSCLATAPVWRCVLQHFSADYHCGNSEAQSTWHWMVWQHVLEFDIVRQDIAARAVIWCRLWMPPCVILMPLQCCSLLKWHLKCAVLWCYGVAVQLTLGGRPIECQGGCSATHYFSTINLLCLLFLTSNLWSMR